MFNTLHATFMEPYTELWSAVDPIAERICALGHPATGSYAAFAALARLPEAPAKPPKAAAMIRILAPGHQSAARTAGELLPRVDKARDEPGADLPTRRLEAHERATWMLLSLLEE